MIQPLKPCGAYSLASCSTCSTTVPVQAAFDLFAYNVFNEKTAIAILDNYGGIADFNLPGVSYSAISGPCSFFNRQYSSLPAWSTIGDSSYHALQVTLRKHTAKGLQLDLNYTFSKSLDICSDAERAGAAWSQGGFVTNS